MRLGLRITIIIIAVCIVAGGVFFGWWQLNERLIKPLNAAEELNAEYYSIYGDLSDTVYAYTVTAAKPSGKEVTADDIAEIPIAASLATRFITDADELLGKFFRVNVSEDTLLTANMLMEFPQRSDERAYDVITAFNPIGLKENDFVDIRINLPMGEDYIALSHKRVAGIYGGILKLVMSEWDITVYNSLMVDAALFGATLYATKYTEPGSQSAAEVNYPIALNILQSALKDPNIAETIDYQTIMERRLLLEEAATGYTDNEVLATILKESKNRIPQIIQSGEQAYKTQKELEEQRSLEAAIINGVLQIKVKP